jgi:hypothetical protein
MTFLPIVARELRVAARRPATFWTRTIMALGAIGVGIFLFLANLESPSQFASQRIFLGLIFLSSIFCLLAGRRFTADSISEEKREGTLGLLFLTDLKGYDIVLGKLAATSLNGFYGLLAIFPMLAVPMLMGGITNGEFWRAVLGLANTFLFSLAVGVFASAISREARRAMGANLVLLIAIIGLPGALAGALFFFLPTHPAYHALLFSCPLYSLYWCDDSLYRAHQSYYWCSVATVHVLTWGLLTAASWVVPRSWQDRSSRAQPRGAPLDNQRQVRRIEYRRRLLNVNAFYWLAARSRFKSLQVWGLFLFIGLWWLWATWQLGPLWLTDNISGTNLATAIMLNVALKLWIGLEACRQLAEDRKAGAFELLFSTSLTVHDVIRGQFLALRRQFLWPTVLAGIVVLIFMIAAVEHALQDRLTLFGMWLAAIALFAVDVTALVWTSMFCALSTRGPNHATVLAVTRIILIPSLILVVVIVIANVTTAMGGISDLPFLFYFSCWVGLGLLADLVYGLAAWRRLPSRFRQLACEGALKKTASSLSRFARLKPKGIANSLSAYPYSDSPKL